MQAYAPPACCRRRSTPSPTWRCRCSTRRLPTPTEAAVRAAVELYRSGRCDGLIAVGGGSAIDCAKGVAIAATHEGPLKTYATIEGGSPKITDRVGAADCGAHHQRHRQRGGARCHRHRRRPSQARLSQLVPDAQGRDLRPRAHARACRPGSPAATGMDAIAHCMETFMSAAFNPPADGIGARRGSSAPGATSSAQQKTAATARRA